MSADTLIIIRTVLEMVSVACAVAAPGVIGWLAYESWKDKRREETSGRYRRKLAL